MVVQSIALVAFTVFVAASSSFAQQPETLSLLGKPLVAPNIPDDTRRTLEAELATARAAYDKDPNDPDAVIWLARRTAYLGRFGESIEILTRGIEAHPDEPRFYRHRGHRFITIRKFDLAIKDLRKAAQLVEGKPDQVEPDGRPNERNVPTSTLQTNIYYHLGLAHYLKGEFGESLDAYRKCLALSQNPDVAVATTNWLYMTLQRLGKSDEAKQALEPITPGMDVIENKAYYQLLMFYKGQTSAPALTDKGTDGVTLAYGVANHEWYSGSPDKAKARFKQIVEKSVSQWPSFGYIAAEAEMARLAKSEHKKHKDKKKK
jgi:tetratricopeptide (TPR) repeat protein